MCAFFLLLCTSVSDMSLSLIKSYRLCRHRLTRDLPAVNTDHGEPNRNIFLPISSSLVAPPPHQAETAATSDASGGLWGGWNLLSLLVFVFFPQIQSKNKKWGEDDE